MNRDIENPINLHQEAVNRLYKKPDIELFQSIITKIKNNNITRPELSFTSDFDPYGKITITPQTEQLIESHITEFQNYVITTYKLVADQGITQGVPEDAVEDLEGWYAQFPTAAEHSILYCLTAGMTNKEIGDYLKISDQTVKNFISHLNLSTRLSDRSSLTFHAIEKGVVNPFIFDTRYDYSLFNTMSERERQAYDQIILSRGSSNSDLAEKLFITEQTVKNHLTNMYKKIKIPNKNSIALYDYKRNELLISDQIKNMQLSNVQAIYLAALAADIDTQAINHRFHISAETARTNMDELCDKFNASNTIEILSLAAYHDIIPKYCIAPITAYDKIEALDDNERLLLTRYSHLRDTTQSSMKADLLGINPVELESSLKVIREKINVKNIKQACIINTVKTLDVFSDFVEEKYQEIDRIELECFPTSNEEDLFPEQIDW